MDYTASAVTGSTEIVPLSHRMWGLTIFRVVNAATLLAVGAASGPAEPVHVAVSVAYVLVVSSFTALLYTSWRRLRMVGFSTALILDGVFLQYQAALIGEKANVSAAAFLVAVCLLASFRTGLKLALWQSLLMLVALRGQQAALFPAPPGGITTDRDAIATQVLLWLVVLTAAAAAAVNERELRRRRYDAEALQRFAVILHQDGTPDQVAHRSLRFTVEELLAERALVVRQRGSRLDVVAGYGDLGKAAGSTNVGSALLSLAATRREPSLVRRLDPERDPWLTQLLPQARRLIVVRLDVSDAGRTWLVVQRGQGRGSRVERRLVATIAQLGATTALALSRAELLEDARMAALLDPLTGIGNRRRFDEIMAVLSGTYRSGGRGFAVAMVDVDRFKAVNDSLGHSAGDEVLRAVADALRDGLAGAGRGAVVCRYGGEEFVVVLPDADAARAAAVAETLRLGLHAITDPTRVTASIGVAAVPGDTTDPAAVVPLADAALYRAKASGRDRVAMASSTSGTAAPGVAVMPGQGRRGPGTASTTDAATSSTQ